MNFGEMHHGAGDQKMVFELKPRPLLARALTVFGWKLSKNYQVNG